MKETEVATVVPGKLLEECIPLYLYTVVLDNGNEFTGCKEVAEKLYIDYFLLTHITRRDVAPTKIQTD